MNTTNNQAVTAALKAAGFISYFRTRDMKRDGYKVVQVSRTAVGVMSDMTVNPAEYSKQLEGVLVAAGFQVTRPFPDATLLRVVR